MVKIKQNTLNHQKSPLAWKSLKGNTISKYNFIWWKLKRIKYCSPSEDVLNNLSF